MPYKPLTEKCDAYRLLFDFLARKFEIDLKQTLRDRSCLIISTNKDDKVWNIFLSDKGTWEVIRKYKQLESATALGLKIAEIYKNSKKIVLTLAGILFFSKFAKRAKVFVNDIGEQIFLYGKDIFKKSIVKIIYPPKGSRFVFVFNKYNDCLGLGRLLFSPARFKYIANQKVAVKNIVDLGIYLRQGY